MPTDQIAFNASGKILFKDGKVCFSCCGAATPIDCPSDCSGCASSITVTLASAKCGSAFGAGSHTLSRVGCTWQKTVGCGPGGSFRSRLEVLCGATAGDKTWTLRAVCLGPGCTSPGGGVLATSPNTTGCPPDTWSA